jgi:hypothetical protein
VGDEEILPEIKVGLDPQKCLAHSDERRDVEYPAWKQMMELDLVVMQEPAKEGAHRQPLALSWKEASETTSSGFSAGRP